MMESLDALVTGERVLGRVDAHPLGEGRLYRIDDEEIAVFRGRDGRLFAVQATCTHLGGPLYDGLMGNGTILCPLHGFAFDLATGDPVRHGCRALRTFAIRMTDLGDIVLDPTRSASGQPCSAE